MEAIVMDYKPLSASTLFHYTNNIDSLLEILKDGFCPRYCLEDQSQFGIEGEIAIPMISFCDIPLSQIRKHICYYGKYAIGLSKAWGIKNKISPVMYTTENAISAAMIKNSLSILDKNSKGPLMTSLKDNYYDNTISPILMEIARRQYAFLAFIKLYEGKIPMHDGYNEEIVRFYDEREWRFVPLFEDMIKYNIPNRLQKDEFLNKASLRTANNLLRDHFNISFDYEDIKYIIIENEGEILEVTNKLSELGDRYSAEQLDIIKTRIISMEQILNDF